MTLSAARESPEMLTFPDLSTRFSTYNGLRLRGIIPTLQEKIHVEARDGNPMVTGVQSNCADPHGTAIALAFP